MTISNFNSDWSKETKKFLRSKQWKLVRDLTFEHFDKVCTNCNSTDNIHLDHIKPRVKDAKGLHWLDITNLQPLCGKCNCEVKGILDTDYRSHKHKEKCRELKSLFEQALIDEGFDKSWTLWLNKPSKKKKRRIEKKKLNNLKSQNNVTKKLKCPEKKRDTLESKIKDFINDNTTFDEVISQFNISNQMPNYSKIVLFIKHSITNEKDACNAARHRVEERTHLKSEKKEILKHNEAVKREHKKRKKIYTRLNQLNDLYARFGSLRKKEIAEFKDLLWKKKVSDDFFRNIK